LSKCPYTAFIGLFSGNKKNLNGGANALRVTVEKGGEKTVDVTLPARSARWLMELIPDDVMEKIRLEKIPIDSMQKDLEAVESLFPQEIFLLNEPGRAVRVWLE
jgi:hypothetical protein